MSDLPFKAGDRVRVWRHYPYALAFDYGTATDCFRADEGVVLVKLDDGRRVSLGWEEADVESIVDTLARLASG